MTSSQLWRDGKMMSLGDPTGPSARRTSCRERRVAGTPTIFNTTATAQARAVTQWRLTAAHRAPVSTTSTASLHNQTCACPPRTGRERVEASKSLELLRITVKFLNERTVSRVRHARNFRRKRNTTLREMECRSADCADRHRRFVDARQE